VTPYRERDGRTLARDLLEATGAFDGVYLAGLPEDRGQASDDRCAAAIEPAETELAVPWDDAGADLLFTCRVHLTILARHEDPQTRDELAERLLYVAASILGGASLGPATLPGRTVVRSWVWQKPVAPERRIAAVLEYQYLVDSWPGLDTAE
jgi:hypothetical protein